MSNSTAKAQEFAESAARALWQLAQSQKMAYDATLTLLVLVQERTGQPPFAKQPQKPLTKSRE